MNNSLVAEDKLKFPCQVGLVAAGRELIAFVEAGARGVLRIRHLYDQSVKDLTVNYQQPIQEVYLTHLNYIVLVNAMKEIEVSLLKVEGATLQLLRVQSFKKANMVQMYCYGRWLVTLTNSSIDLYEYKEAERVSKLKCEVGSLVKHISMNGENIYTYSADGRVRQYNAEALQQQQPTGRDLFGREGMQAIEAFSFGDKDYLAIVGEDNTLEVLPVSDGDSYQLQFQGQFRRLIIRNNLLDVVTYSQKVERHNFFSLSNSPDGAGLVVRSERYQRGSAGCYWLLLNVSSSEVACYLKRRATTAMKPVVAIGEETTSLLYILSATDRTKMDVFKVSHQSLLQGPPAPISKLPNPIKMDAVVGQLLDPIVVQPTISKKKSEPVAVAPSIVIEKKPVHINFQVVEIPPASSPQQVKEKKSESLPPKPHVPDPTFLSQVSAIVQSNSFRQAIEQLLEKKLEPMLWKMGQIDQRLQSLERRLESMEIAAAKEPALEQLYEKTLQSEVLGLMESRVMPKLDEYFKGLFVELGKVFEQGISYYNNKLNVESVVQRDAFEKLIQVTFKTTNEVIESARQQFEGTSKVQQLLESCLRAKEEIMQRTQQLLGVARTSIGKLEEIVPKEPPRDPPREDRRKSFKRAPM